MEFFVWNCHCNNEQWFLCLDTLLDFEPWILYGVFEYLFVSAVLSDLVIRSRRRILEGYKYEIWHDIFSMTQSSLWRNSAEMGRQGKPDYCKAAADRCCLDRRI